MPGVGAGGHNGGLHLIPEPVMTDAMRAAAIRTVTVNSVSYEDCMDLLAMLDL